MRRILCATVGIGRNLPFRVSPALYIGNHKSVAGFVSSRKRDWVELSLETYDRLTVLIALWDDNMPAAARLEIARMRDPLEAALIAEGVIGDQR
jgi:hypothetical protein